MPSTEPEYLLPLQLLHHIDLVQPLDDLLLGVVLLPSLALRFLFRSEMFPQLGDPPLLHFATLGLAQQLLVVVDHPVVDHLLLVAGGLHLQVHQVLCV